MAPIDAQLKNIIIARGDKCVERANQYNMAFLWHMRIYVELGAV